MDLSSRLAEIEAALDSGSYRPGPWQAFLEQAGGARPEELLELSETITRISDKLHRRSQPTMLAFERALAGEILIALLGLGVLALAVASESAVAFVLAAGLLALSFQPLLKVSTGLLLGLDYSYGYLKRGEPRFKLRYGSYLATAPWKRVCTHASGALGSPFAWLLVSVSAAASRPGLGLALLWLAVLHLSFQAGLFALAFSGRRRVPVVGTLRLTSPGGAGWELRRLRATARAPS